MNKTNSEIGQLFFSTYDDMNFDEEKSKVVTIGCDNKMHEYIIDMSDNLKWKGIIMNLRFDPTGYDNITQDSECKIEYIQIA